MPLVPALLPCDVNFSGIILFIRWSQLKQGVTWLSGYIMLLAPVRASHDTNSIVNDTILFARSRWLKQGET